MPLPAPRPVQPPSPAAVDACLLAFDSATEMLAVALQKGTRVWTHDGPGGAVASVRLIPEIRALLDAAELALSDLDAIAFGAGPGAFTGLRTACSVAQGLAFGASLPVVAIDSLMVVAEAAREEATDAAAGGPVEVHVATDARMDQIYAAAYRWVDGRWHVLTPPALHTPASLQASWCDRPPRLVAGSAASAFGARLERGDALLAQPATARGAALVRVAQQQWRAGALLLAHEALPLYLRDKVAQTIAERRAAGMQQGIVAGAAR